jgi:hypothetical protein
MTANSACVPQDCRDFITAQCMASRRTPGARLHFADHSDLVTAYFVVGSVAD